MEGVQLTAKAVPANPSPVFIFVTCSPPSHCSNDGLRLKIKILDRPRDANSGDQRVDRVKDWNIVDTTIDVERIKELKKTEIHNFKRKQ